MILEVMLQRLYQSLLKGPGLNARPHNSRQRVDVSTLGALSESFPANAVAELLASGKIDIPAKAERFNRPDYPEAEWSEEQKAQRSAWDKQSTILRKLSGIVTDAKEYFNDHGEAALFVGYPLISIPPKDDRQGFGSSRVVAPLAMIPISLTVRTNARPGISVTSVEEGADRVIPNPALLAWIERMTGESADDLFADENGDEPWKELSSILEFVARGTGIPMDPLTADSPLVQVPKTDSLPDGAAILNSAVIGLFPMRNPGMIRDTQWMSDNETALTGPVRSFLKPEAINGDSPGDLPEAESVSAAEQASFERDFSKEYLITRADPCQTAAVEEAASARALVIHGPPGTGKSQTIANIIGDHLARGERVLFVCDKRTALDVVKYRLDALGIGHLCGVIHDPQRDRKTFYMGLRERLERLVEIGLPADEKKILDQVNNRLSELHQELRETYRLLHGDESAASFHSLVGEWMAFGEFPEVEEGAESITSEILESHKTTITELCGRAQAAKLSNNPLHGILTTDLDLFFTTSAGEIETQINSLAETFPLPGDNEDIPPIPATGKLESIAVSRATLAKAIERYRTLGFPDLTKAILKSPDTTSLSAKWAAIENSVELTREELDPELALQSSAETSTLSSINSSIVALRNYLSAMESWTNLFAFSSKKAAGAKLAKFGLQLGVEQARRTEQFLEGQRARIIVADFIGSLAEESHNIPISDSPALRSSITAIETGFELSQGITADETLIQNDALAADLAAGEPGNWSNDLETSATRATALAQLLKNLQSSGTFVDTAIAQWEDDFRAGKPGNTVAEAITKASTTVEALLRAEDCLHKLPPELAAAGTHLATTESDPDYALETLARTAIGNEIRARILSSPDLARIDTVRIEAAFTELGDRIAEKQNLVRSIVTYSWQKRQSDRLLATTGSRLNSTGSSLRQRLYVRGKKALRLRQMIATGADIEGGDPLFDLCPIWMASPDTVAQIFPRAALFDVAIFDEASQCRLEEALPVLLRAKRLVVAGDPKQLPPTRFFEGSVIDSDEGEIETEEDLHAHQMSETEDLLGAALNLDVAEAYLDVHYRSRNEGLIGFSNDSFYGSRLQPIPGHPKNKALSAPVRLKNIEGTYKDQSNPAEAIAVVETIKELLDSDAPPSIGIATFNIKQRNLILELLDEEAASEPAFAEKLTTARSRRGSDSFEGLFVKNLENVQGDERDVMVISTTFGRDESGKFRRNFGALSRVGGERRLNVLVTRARDEILIVTSIPREEYQSGLASAGDAKPNGRHFLYAYLSYAERLEALYTSYHDSLEAMKVSGEVECEVAPANQPSLVARALGKKLCSEKKIGSTVHWGNNGFLVDVALTHPLMPEDVTIGVLADFNRYRNTPDPVDWELFRTEILRTQGWQLQRIWSPRLFRDTDSELARIAEAHKNMLLQEDA